MYICLMHSKELLKGTLKTIVLKLLSENNRMYGYEITRHVEELSLGQLKLTEGALYPTLHKMESMGLLNTEKESIGKRVRKYYSLTNNGKSALTEKLAEFDSFIALMQLILKPKTN